MVNKLLCTIELGKVSLQDYGFRDYSPAMKRFTTIDPIRSGSNWYVYVNNNPINLIDPWGLTAEEIGGIPYGSLEWSANLGTSDYSEATNNPFITWAEKPSGAPLTDSEAAVQIGIGSLEMLLGTSGIIISGTASTVGGAMGIFPSLWIAADGANLISEGLNNTKAVPLEMFIKFASPLINTGEIKFVEPLP